MQEKHHYTSIEIHSQRKTSGFRECIIPITAVVICLMTRFFYFGKYIDEWDSVNFAFGLSKGYDILHDQPHFPGYPVYMFFSWIWYKILGSDIQALVLSGVLFSSFAVFPLYELARRMFSKKVAIITAAFYIVNPQLWLQAEKPLSDAFGIFFVITSLFLFYRAIECVQEAGEGSLRVGKKLNAFANAPLWYFAWGGTILGLGLGVRVTYLALIPIMAYTGYHMRKKINTVKVALWGLSGIALGIGAWLGYLLVRFTPYKCYKKFLGHSDYHFNQEGNSIVTASDYGERLVDIFYRLTAHCMGTWWIDTPFLRIIPTILIVTALYFFFLSEKWNLRNKFLLTFFIPYFLWIALIQDAIRQVMVLIPFLMIVFSAGLFHFYVHYLKAKKGGVIAFFFIVVIFVVSQTIDSRKILAINRNEEPPSVARIKYITENFHKEDTKFYCLNDWRLFQYYAPEWSDRKNSHVYFESHMNGVRKDMRRLRNKPKYILISSKLYGRHKYDRWLKKLAEFERNPYSVADYNWLALYSFERR
ncbi:MAG: glycosyltransferase family 39 protein [Candidatus Brocadiaceae bacterium]|nr:glycosyltransferase family 39 protein [Candidatus Brocadiaceae bacterium]